MGIVNNLVTDSIRDSGITDDFVPAGYWKLGYKHRRSSSMSILEDFQQGEAILCIKGFETNLSYQSFSVPFASPLLKYCSEKMLDNFDGKRMMKSYSFSFLKWPGKW